MSNTKNEPKPFVLPQVVYLLFSKATWGAIPFLNIKGCPFIFADKEEAQRGAEAAEKAGCKGISVHELKKEQVEGNLPYWAACGVQALYYIAEGSKEGTYIPISINLKKTDGELTTISAGYYVNAGMTNLMITAAQHKDSGENDGTNKAAEQILPAMLHNGLFLVPMAYEGEEGVDNSQDKTLHALTHVPQLIGSMIKEERINLSSRDEIHFYGADTYHWAENVDPRKIALFDATNKANGERWLVAFTDAFTLRRMYPKSRIIVATMKDLEEHLKKNEEVLKGLTINPGTINYNLTMDGIEKILTLPKEVDPAKTDATEVK